MSTNSTQPHELAVERARWSLDGLSVGDAFGIRCYWRNRELPVPPWRFTDDTNMALSIFSILCKNGEINQDALAQDFCNHYDVERGYGPAMDVLMRDISRGKAWRGAARNLFGGQGSFGNGSAMRVAPVGAYFADDLPKAADQARRSAEVTHCHPEAIAGAMAVAVAAAVAWQQRQELPSRPAFIDDVLPHIPDSQVKSKVQLARDLAPGGSVLHAADVLGNGSHVTCQDTVPFVLWCAGEYLYDYEEALWACGSAGGDRDTTCAMVGGIVVMYTGQRCIPSEWLKRREVLPNWPFISNKC